mgnify:FL=1
MTRSAIRISQWGADVSEQVFCPQCGAQNPIDYRFCVQCRAPRPEAMRPVANPPPEGSRARRGLVTKVAAGIMGLICLASLWTLLRPGSDYSAAAYVEPASYHCTFGGVHYIDNDGIEREWTGQRTLDVGGGNWTISGDDNMWGYTERSGVVVHDPGDDTLRIRADIESVLITGISALRFREGTVLSVDYHSQAKDGSPAETVAMRVEFKKERTQASFSSEEFVGDVDGFPFQKAECSSQP